MFKPLSMKKVQIQVLTEDVPHVSLILAQVGVLHPDCNDCDEALFPTVPGGPFREIYAEARARLDKIRAHVKLPQEPELRELRVVTETELRWLNNWLGEIWSHFSSFEEKLRQLADAERMVEELSRALDDFANLNLDLSLLQGEKQFLDIQIGVVPSSGLRQLEEAAKLAEHITYSFHEKEGNAHVVIVGPRGQRENEIKAVLDTAGFRKLTIPPELRNEPEEVRRELAQRREDVLAKRGDHIREITEFASAVAGELTQVQATLAMAAPFVELETAARSSGYLSVVSGWIPARDIRRTEQQIANKLSNPFRLAIRDPRPAERSSVPTVMLRGRLLAPFAELVKQYGIPRYGEVDPTLLFALTFILMFGMMFGDIGHGATIMGAAWLGRKRLKSFTPFVVAAGGAAVLFGLAYGSIFGYEELVHPLWIAPLSDPILMLKVAVGWGIGFIVMVTALSIHNRIVDRDYLGALFESNGVASIVLYLSLLYAVYELFSRGESGVLSLSAAVLSLATLMAWKWRETRAPVAERVLVVFVETLETITSYFSNTLSFLRVTAFSLNHVALAIAVFTLADTMSATGYWVTVVLGNIFILVLEGAIVTIQALRLEYFEGFSRFFSGDGREFRPLRLAGGANS